VPKIISVVFAFKQIFNGFSENLNEFGFVAFREIALTAHFDSGRRYT
jgi:hypothetical protein